MTKNRVHTRLFSESGSHRFEFAKSFWCMDEHRTNPEWKFYHMLIDIWMY